MALFPSRDIHVGGDEAPKFEWSECKRAQKRMDELDLNSEDKLQSWFIRQMNTHITNAGRRLIGGDKIMEGGTAEVQQLWPGPMSPKASKLPNQAMIQ